MNPLKVLIVFDKPIPVLKYGGIQRIVWWLGKELTRQGHKVTFLVGEGSHCPFAEVKIYDPEEPLEKQIPEDIDVIHSYIPVMEPLKKPYLVHMESNTKKQEYDINTVFVSRNHAERHHAVCYVHNGLDPDDYGKPDFKKKNYLHFLGKAAWRVKNVKGAIEVAQKSNWRLHVIGGSRVNFHMGFRFTIDPRMRFHGMIGGERKNKVMNASSGLLFPVVWNEPFGIAITESMYFGCPVFATPYGSIPEIVDHESGFLTADKAELIKHLKDRPEYNARQIHERVMEYFSVKQMTESFLKLYERVMNGEQLNPAMPYFEKDSEPKFLPFG
ncbi:Glycosyl transferase, group 1 [Fulvivirga imtechensis AK7]|uniref:Glycosyl transferase, group 1 n=1 Tax=Fulvivirga imtechensis AK7 TaxID=1237149 RepID=L8K201_9BACT|nr:glycosyltransferase family 4 protein [Fulvivirga imtechensis]ELR73487.1 Glycosyl transferase, group 1 [Fulvivirga imtechensis AK7]